MKIIEKIKNNKMEIAFFLPAFLMIFIFRFIPMIAGFLASLTEWSIIGTPEFNGISNYIELMNDPGFHNALINTMYYSIILIPSLTLGSLGLALLVNSLGKGQNIFKAVYYLPMVIPLAIGAVIWKVGIYSPFGFINQIITNLGFDSIQFLGRDMAKQSISLTLIWRQTGYWGLMYLAGLKSIPRTLYDAADVDGASIFQKFIYITWPLLKPITLMIVILTTIASFRVFAIVYTMTAGGPGGATKSLLYYVYQLGWQDFRMGYASAVAIIFLAIVLALNFLQKKIIGDADNV